MSSENKQSIGIDELFRPVSDFIELEKTCKCIENERDRLQKECNNLKQVIASIILNQGVEFFAFDDDVGFHTFDTMQEAVDFANDMIDMCRSGSAEYWPTETDNICCGVIIQRATPVSTGEDDTDYQLKGVDVTAALTSILKLCEPQLSQSDKGNE